MPINAQNLETNHDHLQRLVYLVDELVETVSLGEDPRRHTLSPREILDRLEQLGLHDTLDAIRERFGLD